MKIIVAGCGKVGQTLAEQLSNEDNEVIVIDPVYAKVQDITGKIDVMGIVGNAAIREVQQEADIEKADIMIAVTGSDELNLLCCLLAKKFGNRCKTIARIRNPEYINETNYLKEELGLAMAINPEYAAAKEISKVLKFPSAIKIDSFAKGMVEVLKFRIREDSPLDGMVISDLDKKVGFEVLICAVEREDEVFIPKGQFRLKQKDIVAVVVSQNDSYEFFKRIGIKINHIRKTMIVGGGDIAFYLCKILQSLHMNITIIEKNKSRCEYLSEALPNVTLINGDASEKTLLFEEGLEQAQSFIALTNMDEENIMLSLFARMKSNAKLITKINRTNFDEVVATLDLDTIVDPKTITADYIIQFVRSMKNSMDSNVETMHRIMGDKVEALEFVIREKSPVVDVPLEKLKIKNGILIACINREGKMITPKGKDVVKVGDSVVIVTTLKGLVDIKDILE